MYTEMRELQELTLINLETELIIQGHFYYTHI